jgi:molecular chaperone Hsp33
MTEHDTLQRFLFTHANIRGEIHLNDTYKAVADRHPYPLATQKLLGEALAAAALLSATIKYEGTLLLQIKNAGAVTLLIAQSDDEYHLRGLAQWREGALFTDAERVLFSAGQLALTITPKEGARYQSVVELANKNIAAALEKYFRESEQLPSFLFLCADEKSVAGMLLQLMPDDGAPNHYSSWEHIVHLARTISAEELLQLDNQTVLKRLFHEETIQLFVAEPVSFQCTCTLERMERALLLMDYQELQQLLLAEKEVIVACEFCNNHYAFDAASIRRIFAQAGNSAAGSKVLH